MAMPIITCGNHMYHGPAPCPSCKGPLVLEEVVRSTANDVQVGGDHYKKREYQHWDFATDVNLHYLIGCASKYPTRWRDKNGKQDLEKALHYLQKAEEGDVLAIPYPTAATHSMLLKFAGQFPTLEALAITNMCLGNYEAAADAIRRLLAMFSEERATES